MYSTSVKLLLPVLSLCASASFAEEPGNNKIAFQPCHENDSISLRHCTCDSNAVSCDFAGFSPNSTHAELELHGNSYPPNATRLCICNTPRNLHLTFTSGLFLPGPNSLQRFDLHNLTGKTHLNGGFKENFSGDLILSSVRYIPKIGADEFGRGSDNLKPNEKTCCSPVKLNAKYKRPVLFMKKTYVGEIATRGINDNHLWSTVIIRSSELTNINSEGIVFNALDSGRQMSVAVVGCSFKNVSSKGLKLSNMKNLIITKSAFDSSVDASAVEGCTNLNGSAVVLMNNRLLNHPAMNFSASNVIVQHNLVDVLDSKTFWEMSSSESPPQNASFQFNSIKYVGNLSELSMHLIRGNLKMGNNVMGACNCSQIAKVQNKAVIPSENWCYTGDLEHFFNDTVNCSIRLDHVMSLCQKSNPTDFRKQCEKTEGQLKVKGLATVRNARAKWALPEIKSDFLRMIIQEFRLNISTASSKDGNGQAGKISTPNHTSVTAILVVISLTSIVMLVVGVLLFRNRRRLPFRFSRGYQSDDLGGSREVLI